MNANQYIHRVVNSEKLMHFQVVDASHVERTIKASEQSGKGREFESDRTKGTKRVASVT